MINSLAIKKNLVNKLFLSDIGGCKSDTIFSYQKEFYGGGKT